jgi:polyisoprenoid-binding protein YceI
MGLAAVAGAALLSVAAVQAADAPQPPGALDKSRISGGTYSIDTGHTLIGWKVNHWGINDYFGIFGSPTGKLQLDPANVAASQVEVTIPVSKVVTASTGLTAHLLRDGKDGAAPDFFGSAPADAVFKSTEVRPTEENQALVTGMLTMNGVTKPISFMAEFTGAGAHPMNQKELVGFHGWGSFNRSEFGLGYGIPNVPDEVRLDITAAFVKD